MNVLCLPDFVGHPMCFSALRRALEGRAACRLVSYHDFWPYADMDELAARLAATLDAPPAWVLGYSFGGLVAYELFRRLSFAVGSTRLFLLDASLCVEPCGVGADAAETILAALGGSRLEETLALLVELGEINRDCVAKNLQLFDRYAPSGTVAGAHLLNSLADTSTYKSSSAWLRFVGSPTLRTTRVAHEDLLVDVESVALIADALAGGGR